MAWSRLVDLFARFLGVTCTLSEIIRHEGEAVKGSRFLVALAPASTEEAAKEFLQKTRSEIPGASHHCWAWRLASPAIERAGDDGEPSGSAGRPILAQLSGKDMVDVIAVVSRFFGGTKLGIGGLVRAYGGAVGETLRAATLLPYRSMEIFSICYQHGVDRATAELVDEMSGTTVDVVYGTDVVRTVSIAAEDHEVFAARLADLTSGQATMVEQSQDLPPTNGTSD